MSWEWQGTENPDRLTFDFVLFFLSHFQKGEKMSQLDLHVTLKSYLWAEFWNPFWKGSRGEQSSLVFQVLAKWQLLAPQSSLRPEDFVCPKTGADLSHHCWADVITNTAKRWGCVPEMAVQFRESTTWLPYGEPTTTIISRFKNPLQFKYFMLNRFFIRSIHSVLWTICT